ncbi:MAG: ABC transporter permease [Bacteroidaceae bacterium]|nr:ABC transporter permease [Bacteroidaceae bacterium]
MLIIHHIKRVVLREIDTIATQPIYLFCMVVAPIACFILFSTLMYQGLPEKLPVAVVDADNTPTTREIIRNLDAMQQIGIVARYVTAEEAFEDMKRGNIYAIYYIPEGTTKSLIEELRPTISYYLNYSYLVAGSLTYRDMYIRTLLTNAAIGTSAIIAHGGTKHQAQVFVQPIVIETHAIGNPWLSYSIYLNNTIFPGVLSLFIFLLTAYSVTLEIKTGRAKELLHTSGNNIIVAVIGKLIPQSIFFSLTAIFYNLYLYKYLHFPIHDGIGSMILVSILLVIASQSLGLFLAALLPSPRWAMSIASLWGVVSFSISGFSFPIEGMSGSIQAASNLFPLRHYFTIYCNQALLGEPIGYAATHYAALLLFCLLPLPLMGRLKKALENYPYIK